MGLLDWIARRFNGGTEAVTVELQPGTTDSFAQALENWLQSDSQQVLCVRDDESRGLVQLGYSGDDFITVLVNNFTAMDSPDRVFERASIAVPQNAMLDTWEMDSYALYLIPLSSKSEITQFVDDVFRNYFGCQGDYHLQATLDNG